MRAVREQPLWTLSWSIKSVTVGSPMLEGRMWTVPLDTPLQRTSTALRFVLDQLIKVAGSEHHAAIYNLPTALRAAAPRLASTGPRLALAGYGSLREDLHSAHRLLDELGVDHIYYDGPRHEHRWDSGWMPATLDALTRLSTWPR